MKVDWTKANKLYQQMFGEEIDVPACQAVIDLVDDGDLPDEDLIELLDIDNELSKGQLDCIAESLE